MAAKQFALLWIQFECIRGVDNRGNLICVMVVSTTTWSNKPGERDVCVMGRPSKENIVLRERDPHRVFKLERLPDYLRDTVDWIIGRSRRKPAEASKPKRASTTGVVRSSTKPHSSELCVCDSIDDQMINSFTSLPKGIDQREWLAMHTLALFDHVNALMGSLNEICTPVRCPNMNYPGTSKAPYVDERGKRHFYGAMLYMECVMSHCEKASRNEDIFPTKYGKTFGPEFEGHVKRIVRMLWTCCGHLYQEHLQDLSQLELKPQFGLVLAHMARLSSYYNLLDSRDQNLLEGTLAQARPPLTHMIAGLDDSDVCSSHGGRASRVPSSKSGSWGGHPSPAVLTCKPYAQTC